MGHRISFVFMLLALTYFPSYCVTHDSLITGIPVYVTIHDEPHTSYNNVDSNIPGTQSTFLY